MGQDYLHFFTRREIEKLFYRANYQIRALHFRPDPAYPAWQASGRTEEVKVGRMQIGPLSPEEAAEFFVDRFLVTARLAPAPEFGLTSIIIVCHDQLPFLQQCVDRIRLVTDEPHELIVVDNGSQDGTVEYVQSLPGVQVILNPENRGFAAAANQAVQVSTGKQVVFLDPTTLVTTGWLKRLLAALFDQSKVGLTGPCSNAASGAQRVAVSYTNLGCLDGFAWDWGKQQAGRREKAEALDDSCCLVRREILSAVGTFPGELRSSREAVQHLCQRSNQAGWELVIARDAFVHRMIEEPPAASTAACNLSSEHLEPTREIPPHVSDAGLTSIILVTFNQLEYTRLCLDSIRRNTSEPYELIIIDNASTDGTRNYLMELDKAKVIFNPTNLGFPAAVNQGMRAAKGRQVLLLNNDCVVPAGWLGRLLTSLHSHPQIGLVGPCSNCVSGEQQIPVSYKDLKDLDEFARRWAQANPGRVQDTDRLVGFCLLIKRAVIDAVGLLDEQFGMGNFEDDDYCLRAVRAGFRAVIAREAFVHHFGGRSFVGNHVDFTSLMEKNQQLFRTKWETEKPVAAVAPKEPIEPPAASFSIQKCPGGGLELVVRKIHLSLCMIVRDNAGTIKACLESIRPWVDEMIVVDTGSVDQTPEIAARLGARVFHFPWCDSFSAARNESLRHARGQWIFWMDSDDTITAEQGRKLRQLAYQDVPADSMAYVLQVHCPGPGDDGQAEITVVDHVKLFRNLPGMCFEGRIHEQIIPAIRRAGGEIAWTDIFVVHSGYDHSAEGQERKKQRDLKLLHLELQEQPDHPFTLFNLGMTYADIDEHREAVGYLEKSIARSTAGESHLRKAYSLLAHSYRQTKEIDKAWSVCQRALELFPRDPELLFRKAGLLIDRGHLQDAAQAYLDVLQTKDDRHFTSVVQGIQGYLTRQNLAVTYGELGDGPKAEAQWRTVVQERPRYRQGWRGLGDCLLRQRKVHEAKKLASWLVEDRWLRPEGRMLKGQLAMAQGDLATARRELDKAVRDCPGDPEVCHSWCRLLFEHGDPREAEQALCDLLRHHPRDPSAHHNLGTVYLRTGRPHEAIQAFQESLRFRPDSPGTFLSLGYAFKESGSWQKAAEAWQQTLRLAPDNQEALSALKEMPWMP